MQAKISLAISDEEEKKLTKLSRKFLEEADAGGMAYISENGKVLAWGITTEGIFSMDVTIEKNEFDG